MVQRCIAFRQFKLKRTVKRTNVLIALNFIVIVAHILKIIIKNYLHNFEKFKLDIGTESKKALLLKK